MMSAVNELNFTVITILIRGSCDSDESWGYMELILKFMAGQSKPF